MEKLTINYPQISAQKLISRLSRKEGRIRMVLDTDTFNEIDDQFAVVYGLKSPERLKIEAFYAAPFYNELSTGPKDGMEKSYQELKKITELLPEAEGIPIYRGSEQYLPGPEIPVESEAALNLVERPMASSEDDPLYVVGIGAITNIASAILMEPRIIEKIVVVWLGGHGLHWPDTDEFNLQQDVFGARVLLDSGVPLVLIPCNGASSHLQTSLSEIRDYVKGKGAIGEYLYETYKNCAKDHFGYSRVIWDIATIAYLIDDSWLPNSLVHSPILSEEKRWSIDTSRHFIRYVHHVNRNPIFKDFFKRIG